MSEELTPNWSKYRVVLVKGRLWNRQQMANREGCQCYVEQHLNSIGGNPDVNYSMAIVAINASEKSLEWARTYVELAAKMFGHRNGGVVIGGRGSYNVRFVSCPSILLEPGFISNPEFADWVRTGEGIDGLARCMVVSIVNHFPDPSKGPIGLSIGHAFRGALDPGAPVFDKGDAATDPKFDDETELNMVIVRSACEMLDPTFEWEAETIP